MDLLALAQLRTAYTQTRVSDDPSGILGLLGGLGLKVDQHAVELVAKALRATARDPEQTIAEWVRDGGLLRLLAGQKADEMEDMALTCPHCDGTLIITT